MLYSSIVYFDLHHQYASKNGCIQTYFVKIKTFKFLKLRFDFDSSSNFHLPKNWPDLDISELGVCGQMTTHSKACQRFK